MGSCDLSRTLEDIDFEHLREVSADNIVIVRTCLECIHMMVQEDLIWEQQVRVP